MSEPSNHHTFTIRNPQYGPQGQPYLLLAKSGKFDREEWYWTQADALDRRDQLLDHGCQHVMVVGLPTIVSGG